MGTPGHARTGHFQKTGTKWAQVKTDEGDGLKKRHGLQGPIDDAFMDSFVMVRPTGKPLNEQVGAWAMKGLDHAVEQWHLHFRGEARVKDDTAITDEDIAANNLILWGDPHSNQVLTRIMAKLPIRWDEAEVGMLGADDFSSDKYAAVLIYPNPLNPKRYVVLNTGFTFSETGRASNALQIPMLPDYAVVDVTVPLAKRVPNGVVAAGFFDERWMLPTANKIER